MKLFERMYEEHNENSKHTGCVHFYDRIKTKWYFLVVQGHYFSLTVMTNG